MELKTKKNKYRILSIDGGGMKGVFTAYAIWKLEEEFNIKLIDHFDMFVGTSTGAIITSSILIGKSGKEIYDSYIDAEIGIFKKHKKNFKERFTSIFFAAYRNEGIINSTKKNLGEHTLKSLYEISGKKDFAFFASNFTKAKPLIFISPSLITKKDADFFDVDADLIKVIRTTTAAPFYFEPYKDEESENLLLDGGFWANNPSLAAINLAISNKKIEIDNINLLSFGQSFTKNLDFSFGKGTEVLKNPMRNQFVQLLLSILVLNQNSQTTLVDNLIDGHVYRYEPDILHSKTSIDKINKEFLEYSKKYWEKNKWDMVNFIKTGENISKK